VATLASSGDAPQTSLSVQVEPTLPCGSPRRERPRQRKCGLRWPTWTFQRAQHPQARGGIVRTRRCLSAQISFSGEPDLDRRGGPLGELGAHGGQLVGGPGRPLRVGPGNQQPVPLQPLEALGEDVAAIPGDLAEQVIEPLRPAEQRLDQQYRPPVTDLASASASGDEPFCCSAMSGS